jgi:ketosteroid isomerase-like protein
LTLPVQEHRLFDLRSRRDQQQRKEHTCPSAAPDVISRYFDVTAEWDTEAIVALFADDATVVDERCHVPVGVRWR